jgi:GTP pyrophosphokinase
MNIELKYKKRYQQYLKAISVKLENHFNDNLSGIKRIDRICARAKSVDSFIKKAQNLEDGKKKYSDPINQIQDQIGVRIITFFNEDVERVAATIENYYRKIESKDKIPESESEFGYIGKHYILLLPDDVINDEFDKDNIPTFFELQIKTLFQHAWSEANHDLDYKPVGVGELKSEFKRKIAFTAAQAWGADQIFNDLYKEINSN